MTVKDLREELSRFNDDDLVMLSTVEGSGYYPNIILRPFTSKVPEGEFPQDDNDIVVIGCKSPYLKVPFEVVEAGWRP